MIGTRLSEVPDNLDSIDIYKEPNEDRVKFYYDCFVNVPLRSPTEAKQQNGDVPTQNVKQNPPIKQDLFLKQRWKAQNFWPLVVLFDILLVLIVVYIYS